jgi:hypothetical protein
MNKAPKYITEKLWTAELPKELSNSYLDSRDHQLPKVIYPDIRVLTANKGTLNDTFYPEESLRGDADRGTGLISFNRPYAIPILRDHLDTPSADGRFSSDVYGRVYHPAQIHANGGEKYVRCMATITHPEAIEAILTGRWLTVSLGSKTDSVRCSICKAELQEAFCDHQKGKQYEVDDKAGETQKCRWVIGPIRAREISFVVSPSDDQAGVISPNLKESFSEMDIVIPRLLVGDDKGIFDLATGAQVAESAIFARPSAGRFFNGLSFLGSSISIKESQVDKPSRRDKPIEPLSEQEALKWMKEDFIGPGKYLLSGWDHDHTVVLDQRGDGTSTPGQMPPTSSMSPGYMYPTNTAEAGAGGGPARGRGMGDGDNTRPDPAPVQTGDEEDHTHEVIGGRVMKAGYPNHAHDLEPAHAALENAMPDKKTPEADVAASVVENDEAPVTLGTLYNLPEDHPEFNAPDDADESLKEAKLSYAARKNLDASAFCGPDRSFPAHDAAHVRNGLARLSQSNFSAEQKSKIHGCLSGRARKYGIEVGGKEGFAAKLIDTNHHIEFGLYPMPKDFDATETLLNQVKAMPHTPTEKDTILSRIAAHCKDVLPMSNWQFLFGELTNCEAGDPVSIVINNENYGLLYTLSSVSALTPIQPPAETQVEEPKVVENETPVTPVTETDKKEADDAGTIPVIPVPKQIEATNPTVMGEPASDLVRETIQSLQAKATASDKTARLALAHSTALYMKTLRKPFARGKSSEELIEALSVRTADSLRDTLTDLLGEIEAGGTIPTQPLPKVDDPTKSDADTSATKETKSKEAANAVVTPEENTDVKTSEVVTAPMARLTPITEWSNDEEEETFTVLGALYQDLKIGKQKK